MNKAEAFRQELQNRTPRAIQAVKWVAQTNKDPGVVADALDWLNQN